VACVTYKFLHGSNLLTCIKLFVINKSTINIDLNQKKVDLNGIPMLV
jgi:hypothetical protein